MRREGEAALSYGRQCWPLRNFGKVFERLGGSARPAWLPLKRLGDSFVLSVDPFIDFWS
ncbi:hypothetical protein CHELA1G2_11951 [Hyphomicrobiales bacterium]|nr:hypothetical protein CHELA1G2_11951 [Hyphomicrobiales bacterium]